MNSTLKWASVQDQLEYLRKEFETLGASFVAVRSGDTFKIDSEIVLSDVNFRSKTWFIVKNLSLDEVRVKLHSLLESFKNRHGRELDRKASFVSPQNQLKPFLTPRQEVGIND